MLFAFILALLVLEFVFAIVMLILKIELYDSYENVTFDTFG